MSAPALRVEDAVSETNASPLWVGVRLGSRFGERLVVNVMSAAAAAERESADGFCDGFDPLDRGSFSSGGPSSVLRAILVGVLITTTSATSSLPSFSNSDASVNSERSPSPPTAATFLPRAGDRGDQAEATRVARLPGMFRGSPDWSMLGRAGELFGFGGPASSGSCERETGGRRLACDPGREPGRGPARPRDVSRFDVS